MINEAKKILFRKGKNIESSSTRLNEAVDEFGHTRFDFGDMYNNDDNFIVKIFYSGIRIRGGKKEPTVFGAIIFDSEKDAERHSLGFDKTGRDSLNLLGSKYSSEIFSVDELPDEIFMDLKKVKDNILDYRKEKRNESQEVYQTRKLIESNNIDLIKELDVKSFSIEDVGAALENSGIRLPSYFLELDLVYAGFDPNENTHFFNITGRSGGIQKVGVFLWKNGKISADYID